MPSRDHRKNPTSLDHNLLHLHELHPVGSFRQPKLSAMASYEISPNCTVADAKGIANCNVSAYWKETWWRLLWPEKTPESVVEAIAARTPRNLLQMRGLRRHQKVKDAASGEIVGYARWVLPDSHDDKWLEAQTPDVDDAAKAKFKSDFEGADYEPRDDMDEMDDHMWEWRSKYDRDDCLGMFRLLLSF